MAGYGQGQGDMSNTRTGDEHLSNTWIRLSNDSFVRVPDGADVNAFRRVQEARLRLAAKPKKQTQRAYQSRARKHKASGVLGCGSSPFDAGMLATARRLDELAADAVAEAVGEGEL